MYNTIKYLYPNAEDSDFQLRDDSDGNGAYIDFWNEEKLGAKPEISFIISKIEETKILIKEQESKALAAKQALAAKKEAAEAKLAALGLTADDLKALGL